MAREPIKQQGRLGPAQARARVFSIFEPARVDTSAAESLQGFSESVGNAAAYASQQELEAAQREREEGLRDYAAGLVRDGQRIVNGELQPIESEYYMAGVEMGRGRRRGRDVWARFADWMAENPRPGLSDEEGYNAWLERGLASAQEAAGVDPDRMSSLELNEYAGVVNQVRQRDNEQYLSQINQEAVQEQVESINSDIMAMGLEFDSENLDATYSTAQNLLARARANGLDLNAVRRSILTQFSNIARNPENMDTAILENVPTLLKTAELESVRLDLIENVQRDIETAQYEGETEVLQGVQDALQAGDAPGARILLDSANEGGRLRDETYLNWDQRVYNETNTIARRMRDAAIDRFNDASRANALMDAMSNGLAGAGVSWRQADGSVEYMSPEEVAREIEADVFSSMGRTAEAIGYLSNMTNEANLLFPAVEDHFQGIFRISQDKLETGSLSEAETALVESLMHVDPVTIGAYFEGDQFDQLMTARFLQQSGGYSPGEALAMSRDITGVLPEQRRMNHFETRARNRLASNNRTWPQFLTIDDLPFSDHFQFIDSLNIDRYTQYERNAATRAWSAEISDRAARIEQVAGREAANDYIDNAVEGTMIVNRQPVLPVGTVSGAEGSVFMTELMGYVGVRHIAPELDARERDLTDIDHPILGIRYRAENWVHRLLGREDQWNPDDPGLREAFLGELNVSSVPGGVRFELDEAAVFLSNQEIGELQSLWNSEASSRQQFDEATALQEDAPWTRGFQERLAEIIAAGNRGGSSSDYQ